MTLLHAAVPGAAPAAPASTTGLGNTGLTLTVFVVFVAITLGVVYLASTRNQTAANYYTAGSAFTGAQNGLALSGDFLSAASFLGISGAIAVQGYDGFLYSVGWIVAWLFALLLIAERLRNVGRFTVGDVMAYRMRSRPVRAAAAIATLAITLVYMTAQMAGAGGLVALLLGITDKAGQALVIAVVGVIMMLYVLVGGMKGTTWVQIIKAALLMVSVLGMSAYVLGTFGLGFSTLLKNAAAHSPLGPALLAPGSQYGHSGVAKLDFISLALSLVLGISCLPHVLMRFYTVPDAREARRSVTWCSWTMFAFYLAILVVGFGATAYVGSDVIKAAPGGANSAAPLLAYAMGGTVLLGIVAAVAFATILAVVAGLTLTASASFAHDVYASVLRDGDASPRDEVRVARWTAVAVGVLSIGGGIAANGQNVAFLVSLALALAASANLSTLVYTLFWRRFNTSGTLWSIYGGLSSSMVLIIFSPAVSGAKDAMFPSVDFHWFPLTNPALVSVPLSFLFGYLGTVYGTSDDEPEASDKAAEMEVRALTAIGSGLPRPRPLDEQ